MTTPEPDLSDGQVALRLGDCRKILPSLADTSVDAVITDPPYETAFMGKAWDSSGVAYDVTVWRECLRVLKPGGHLLCFGGTRTWHRVACAIEDAGFEMRDTVADLTGIDGPALLWTYGQGYPFSLDVSKAIDKAAGAEREVVGHTSAGRSSLERARRVEMGYRDRLANVNPAQIPVTVPATEDAARWDGWGTVLKPAWEPVIVARKPFTGNVAANVLEHGTGAINIGACRVPPAGESRQRNGEASQGTRYTERGGTNFAALPGVRGGNPAGRHPPNLVLGDAAAAEMERQRQGAPSFFPVFRYQAKVPGKKRPRLPDGTQHPTVKPVPLLQWLARLVTPPGGTVLDPFAGTSPIAEACIMEGFDCIVIDNDPEAIALTRERLSKDIQPGLPGGDAA